MIDRRLPPWVWNGLIGAAYFGLFLFFLQKLASLEITHDPDPEGFVTYARHIQQTGTLMEHRRPPGYPFLLAWVDRFGPGTMHEDALQFHRAVIFICILGMVMWVQRNFGHLVAILFFSMFAIGGNYFVWISSMMMSDLFLSLWFIGYIWAGWKTFKEKSPWWGYLLLGCLFIFGGQAFHSSFCVRACIYTVSTAFCLIIALLIKKKEGKAEVMKKTMLLLISAWATAYWGESLLSIKVEKSNYVNLDNWEKSQNNFISYWLTMSQLASLPPPKNSELLDIQIEKAKAETSKTLGYDIKYKKITSIYGPYKAYGKVFSENKVPLNYWHKRILDNPKYLIAPFLYEVKFSYFQLLKNLMPYEPLSSKSFANIKLPSHQSGAVSNLFWTYGLSLTNEQARQHKIGATITVEILKIGTLLTVFCLGLIKTSKKFMIVYPLVISAVTWYYIALSIATSETRYLLPWLPIFYLILANGLYGFVRCIINNMKILLKYVLQK